MNAPQPKLITHCPLCDTSYTDSSVRLIGEHGGMRLFHMTCPCCAHSLLAVILEHQHGVSTIGMMTDLEAQEAFRFQEEEPISADDCVQAHCILADHSRDFCKAILP